MEYSTLTQLFLERKFNTERGIRFIESATDEKFISYEELYKKSLTVLAQLQDKGISKGDELVFQIQDNAQYLILFWACIVGGIIPVPVTIGNNDEHRIKLIKIWKLLNNPFLIGTAKNLELIESIKDNKIYSNEITNIKKNTLFIEEITYEGRAGEIYESKPDDIGFIQFSSGSTGDPKGVVLTHNNLLKNISAIKHNAEITETDSMLSWMPLTHDMGLIGIHMTGVLAGINQCILPTDLFVRRPLIWMEKANEHKSTLLYSPNFGFKHFLNFLKNNYKTWDLSNIRLIFNGAEPISHKLCNEFTDVLSNYGMQKNTMYTVYGLAEASVAVSFPAPGAFIKPIHLNRNHLSIGEEIQECNEEDSENLTFVEVGTAIKYCNLRIADENNVVLGENRIGNIQIKGENVTKGYYNNQEATNKVIKEDGWLETGDLGFIRNNQLVITGRAKDVLFVNGQNYYSHDIERAVEGIGDIELGKVAVCGLTNSNSSSEDIVMFILFKKGAVDFIPLMNEVSEHISREIGLTISKIIPIKKVPKTTSGKVQRYKLRENYLNGEYNEILEEIAKIVIETEDKEEIKEGADEFEKELLTILKNVTGIEKIGMTTNLFRLGINSLKLVMIMSEIMDKFEVELQINKLFAMTTPEELKSYIQNSEKAEKIVIETAEKTEYYPLATAQNRIYVMEKLEKNSTVYNIPVAYKINGKLETDKVEALFKTLISRHEALRTTIETVNGEAKQKINGEFEFKVEEIRCSENEVAEKIKSFIKPFDISKLPLIRAGLIITGENSTILVIDTHHIISDGISTTLLLNELSELYNGNEIQSKTIEYKDFSVWESRQNIEEKQEKYWVDNFAGTLPILNMPYDNKREALQSYEGESISFMIDKERSSKLKEFSMKNGMTLYMTMLGAYNILLQKYSSQEDIIVGTPVSVRKHSALNSVVGMFVNTLAMRNFPKKEMSVKEFFESVKERSLTAYENSDYHFEKLISKLNIKRDRSRNPLFDTMFTLQNMDTRGLRLNNLGVEKYEIESINSKVDISLEVTEYEDELNLKFEYAKKLFNKETVKRICSHYINILNTIMENRDIKIKDISVIANDEKESLLNLFNKTESEYPKAVSIQKQFEMQVEKTPDKTAVEFEGKTLSYSELNKMANSIANLLKSKGVKSGTITAILIERSLEMAAAILGVLKAGGAYLPLDPEYPEERINYMLEDSGAEIVLTQEKFSAMLENSVKKENIVDLFSLNYELYGNENLEETTKEDDLMYLIYTSGSTGKPKGVMISQCNVSNFINGMKKEIEFTQDKTMMSLTTISFDIFVLEFFIPLTSGMRVVIGDKKHQISGEMLEKAVAENRIDMTQLTPSRLNLLTSGGKNLAVLRNLRDLIIGGEAFPENLFGSLKKELSAKIYNVYGPTETTVWSTIKDLTNESKITIGKPIANTKIYILDENMQLLPFGVTGELWIGGDGVAKGYFKREELTNEKFIDNPFNPGEKIYNTGDLAKWNENGEIEIAGRNDNQVKIRGYRIELGEIENIISEYQDIVSAAIVAKDDTSGFKYLSAYIVSENSEIERELRNRLAEKIPNYMIPSYFTRIEKMPLTPNGKIDRNSLKGYQESKESVVKAENSLPKNEIEKTILNIWKNIIGTEKIGLDDNFFDVGGHSLKLIQLYEEIAKTFKTSLKEIDLFEYTTVSQQAKYLYNEKYGEKEVAELNSNTIVKSEDVAIVGMSCRVPGAKNKEQFWENLCNGKNSISYFSDEELREAGVTQELIDDVNYVKAWGKLDEIEMFDPHFFGYNPREAEIIDPQQRVFLEECYKGLEDAGCDSQKYDGTIGVFAAVGMNTYISGGSNRAKNLAESYQQMISNDKDFLATRVAYKLNLKGPAISVQTACSSSMVAIHLACQSIKSGETDMALAGGVSIRMPQDIGYMYQDGMILSPDGYCRAFDEKARGTVSGNGAGVIVLKRLSKAIEDNDRIYAVVKGSALNNDGSQKAGYTAPSIEGQSNVIARAVKAAGIEADTVSYIEAHGTGTSLGDPIEIQALNRVYGKKDKMTCAVGSVKTNIGHLDSAAGVIGVIKAANLIYRKKLVPSINYEKANPKIDFDSTPFYVNTKLQEWDNQGNILRAGISSFGIGGTNAHAIIEEAPKTNRIEESSNTPNLILLSTKTKEVMAELNKNMAEYLDKNRDINLKDMAYTLQNGRKEMEYRQSFVVSTVEDAISTLSENRTDKIFSNSFEGEVPKLIFMFPGQGTQYVNMGKQLYENVPSFRETVDSCSEILKKYMNSNLTEIFYPKSGEESTAAETIGQTEITQPALFVIEYSLAKLLISFGIKPSAMIGHSIGEYVAGCLAGVFSLEDALKLVALRGKLMQGLPKGSMVAVFTNEESAKKYIEKGLSIALINSHNVTVISGYSDKIEQLKERLNADDIMYKDVKTSHAFHSLMMEPILEEFKEMFSEIKLNSPNIPYVSNLTGKWIKSEEALSPEYWARHLRETVYFAKGIDTLLEEKNQIVIEVGPGSGLAKLISQQIKKDQNQNIVSIMKQPNEVKSDMEFFLNSIGKLWSFGLAIDWQNLYNDGDSKKTTLPSYPFNRVKLWKNSIQQPEIELKDSSSKRKEMKNWFYSVSWKRSNLIYHKTEKSENYLVLMDKCGLGEKLAEKLEKEKNSVVRVKTGEQFEKISETEYCIDSSNSSDYRELFKRLKENEKLPQTILHALTFTNMEENYTIEEMKSLSFYSMMYLAQELKEIEENIKIIVISDNMQNVTGDEEINPLKALITGPVKVIDQENPNILCRNIDLSNNKIDEVLTEKLIADIKSDEKIQFAAYRGKFRWIQDFEKISSIEKESEADSKLKSNGVYLITGGLGAIGLRFAKHIAQKTNSNLILTTTKEFPERDKWDSIEKMQIMGDVREKIEKIREIESLGSNVTVIKADVSNREEMKSAVSSIIAKHGQLNGVIHSAGIAGGGVIQLKTMEMVEKVFKPKVDGTIVLNEVLEGVELDFMILFSSVTAVLGGVGQIDYCSANAFLDAFANSKYESSKTISINWDTWNDIGMAVESMKPKLEKLKESHPLIDGYIKDGVYTRYISKFSLKKWILNEHWILGKAIVPGTTYLELARTAFELYSENRWIEIKDVYFMAPLIVAENQEIDVQTVIKEVKDGYEFSVISQSGDKWLEHAKGKIKAVDKRAETIHDVKEIAAKCNKKEILNPNGDGYLGIIKREEGTNLDEFVKFGSRWNNIGWVRIGEDEGVALLDLPKEVTSDYDVYNMHPAILDSAVAFLRLFRYNGVYLPLSYDKLILKGKIKGKIYSYVKLDEDANKAENEKGILNFNVKIIDENGMEIIDIEKFTMREIDMESLNLSSTASTSGNISMPVKKSSDSFSDFQMENIRHGIKSDEGVKVFDMILSHNLNQFLVSTMEFSDKISKYEEFRNAVSNSAAKVDIEEKKELHPRPDLKSEYVAPKTEIEKRLAHHWQNMLGIDKVGVQDDIFELGGHSLLLVQFHKELKEMFDTDISVVDLYKYTTISLLSKYLTKDVKEEKPKFDDVNERVNKKKEALRDRRNSRRK